MTKVLSMMTKSLAGLIPALALALLCAPPGHAADETQSIVFVCEKGSVKSVMATLFFNRMAVAENLRYRAISRGLTPDEKIPPAIAEALQKEGFDTTQIVPQRLTKEDGTTARNVVGFCNVPVELASAAKTSLWLDIPPVSVDYEKAKAAMQSLVRKLVAELRAERARESAGA
jgi:arsenate reductase (thioredoxin)